MLSHGPAHGKIILDIIRRVLLVRNRLGLSMVEWSVRSDCRVLWKLEVSSTEFERVEDGL